MIKFIIKEIFSSLISLFIFLLIMFYGINLLIPGDFLTPLRLMMSQAELDALRESLGVNDPLYQRYFRWILGVFNGEITTGGFRQRSGKDITSTFFPTIQILIPSFLLAFYISRIPSINTPIKKLHKNKIFSDTFATFLISLFPPIILFLIGSKFDNLYLYLVSFFNIEKSDWLYFLLNDMPKIPHIKLFYLIQIASYNKYHKYDYKRNIKIFIDKYSKN